MATAKLTGDRGACDILFSRLVRARGRCQYCGITDVPFDTAHIIVRRYSATRCHLENAWCLCRTCHQNVDNWPHIKLDFARDTIGTDRYYELVRLAQAGHGTTATLFWRAERERLTKLCEAAGIDTRRRNVA